MSFENVTVNKKANIYFDGKCVSHTITENGLNQSNINFIINHNHQYHRYHHYHNHYHYHNRHQYQYHQYHQIIIIKSLSSISLSAFISLLSNHYQIITHYHYYYQLSIFISRDKEICRSDITSSTFKI